MGKSITFTLTLPSLPELPALPDDPWVWAEALGWLVLVLLLLRVLSQLSAIYALLRPHAAKPPALLEDPQVHGRTRSYAPKRKFRMLRRSPSRSFSSLARRAARAARQTNWHQAIDQETSAIDP